VMAFAKTRRDGRIDTFVRDFLAYLVGPRAQAIIAADGHYIRLTDELLLSEREKLQ